MIKLCSHKKRELSSSYIPAESYLSAILPFLSECQFVLCACTGPGSLERSAIWNKLLSSTVTQAKGASLSRLLIKKIWYEHDIVLCIDKKSEGAETPSEKKQTRS